MNREHAIQRAKNAVARRSESDWQNALRWDVYAPNNRKQFLVGDAAFTLSMTMRGSTDPNADEVALATQIVDEMYPNGVKQIVATI